VRKPGPKPRSVGFARQQLLLKRTERTLRRFLQKSKGSTLRNIGQEEEAEKRLQEVISKRELLRKGSDLQEGVEKLRKEASRALQIEAHKLKQFEGEVQEGFDAWTAGEQTCEADAVFFRKLEGLGFYILRNPLLERYVPVFNNPSCKLDATSRTIELPPKIESAIAMLRQYNAYKDYLYEHGVDSVLYGQQGQCGEGVLSAIAETSGNDAAQGTAPLSASRETIPDAGQGTVTTSTAATEAAPASHDSASSSTLPVSQAPRVSQDDPGAHNSADTLASLVPLTPPPDISLLSPDLKLYAQAIALKDEITRVIQRNRKHSAAGAHSYGDAINDDDEEDEWEEKRGPRHAGRSGRSLEADDFFEDQ